MTEAFKNVFGISAYCSMHNKAIILLNIPTLQPSGLPRDQRFHIQNRLDLFRIFDGESICKKYVNRELSEYECVWEMHGDATLKNNTLHYNSININKNYHLEIYDQFNNDLTEYGFNAILNVNNDYSDEV